MAGIYQNQNWMKDLPQGLMASLTNSQTGTADKKSMKLRDRFDQRNRIAIKIQQDAEDTSYFSGRYSGGVLSLGSQSMSKSPRFRTKIQQQNRLTAALSPKQAQPNS
jgi:hypothetical protein